MKLLLEINGIQSLITLADIGHNIVGPNDVVLWDEREHGNMPEGIIEGYAEVYFENGVRQLRNLQTLVPSHAAAIQQAIAEQESKDALKYLASTDWYIVRELDSGVPCPIEIKNARAAARLKIIS